MKLTRQNLGNIAIAVVAITLFSGFVFLATKGGNKKNDLAIVGTTTTTRRVTTTTTEPETTTSSELAPTSTTAPVITPTTAKSTTTTAKKTTTTTATPTSGRVTEHSDNSASYTSQAGSCTATTGSAPGGTDGFRFLIKIDNPCSVNSDGSVELKLTATLTNNSSKPIAFPDGSIIVTITLHSSGGDRTTTLNAGGQAPLQPGETITLARPDTEPGNGTFDATATCDVDYG